MKPVAYWDECMPRLWLKAREEEAWDNNPHNYNYTTNELIWVVFNRRPFTSWRPCNPITCFYKFNWDGDRRGVEIVEYSDKLFEMIWTGELYAWIFRRQAQLTRELLRSPSVLQMFYLADRAELEEWATSQDDAYEARRLLE